MLMAIVEMLRTGFQSWDRLLQEQRTQRSEHRAEKQFEEWEQDAPLRKERREAELRDLHKTRPLNRARDAVTAIETMSPRDPRAQQEFPNQIYNIQQNLADYAQGVLDKKGLTPEQKWEEIRQGVDGLFSNDAVTMALGGPLLMQALQATGIKNMAGVQSPEEIVKLLMEAEVPPEAIAGLAGFFDRDGKPNNDRLGKIFGLSGGKFESMTKLDAKHPSAWAARDATRRMQERFGDDLGPLMAEGMLGLKGHVSPEGGYSQDAEGWLMGQIPGRTKMDDPGPPAFPIVERSWQGAKGAWHPSYGQARETYTPDELIRLLAESLSAGR